MNEPIPAKRAAVVHDLSGLGRCALGIALPVLGAMGVMACPLPSAALSAHTGGFGAVAKADLTDFMRRAIAHWDELELDFDAIYLGYLLSDAQVALCEKLVENRDGFVLLDPVMADHGRLYSGISDRRPQVLRALCAKASLITPNLTEAMLLLGDKNPDSPVSEARLTAMLDGLLRLGADAALITGVALPDGTHVNAYRHSGESSCLLIPYAPAAGAYPGTGDLFASVLLGSILRGEPMRQAIARAADFVREAVLRTNRLGTRAAEGVQYEALLGRLIQTD